MPKTFFIAEAGKNFIDVNWRKKLMMITTNYFLQNAIKLADAAKAAGADAVKFQTHVFEDEHLFRDKTRHDWIRFNESITPLDGFWKPLKERCDRMGIEFMSTPMSKMAADKVKDLVARWKVGSGNTTDYELLKFLHETNKPVILSTGMSTQKEIAKAIDILGPQNTKTLYCRSIYPCPLSKINFNLMKQFDGFSDHTVEITTPMWAMLTGAKIIEKHFTLDKAMIGPDHSFSLNPEELKICIKLVREYEDTQNPAIVPDEEEIKMLKLFRKNV